MLFGSKIIEWAYSGLSDTKDIVLGFLSTTPFVAHPISIDFPICLHEGEILPVLKAQQKPKVGI